MIINNVKLVLENEVVHGSLEVQDGEIRAFAESQSRLPEAMDGEGGWLLPGLIELHTDNLDKFFTPRPKVDWPAHSAMSSHDALMVASGITTVLDAVAIGDVRDGGDRLENLEKMINAIEETQKRGVNRAEYSAAIFLIPICISFDTAEKRRYATYLILNRRFSFEF